MQCRGAFHHGSKHDRDERCESCQKRRVEYWCTCGRTQQANEDWTTKWVVNGMIRCPQCGHDTTVRSDATCGLCDGMHDTRDCSATDRIQESERAAEHNAVDFTDRTQVEEWLDT